MQLPDYFRADGLHDVIVDAPTIYQVPPYLPHYGHWLTEGVPL